MSKKYWVAAISKEHTLRGIEGGFVQVCHGKKAPLRRMKNGDYILVYSSKISMQGDEKCQSFTAVGIMEDEEIFQYQMTEDFCPFRRKVKFFHAEDVSILPLIKDLDFIPNKKSWGFPFRFGFFEINEKDFNLISSKMLQHEVIG